MSLSPSSSHPDPRQRLLDAGLKVFAAHGYAGATIQEIVREAQVTKPTLYYYFQSKEGLFLALIDWAMDERLRHMRAAAQRATTTSARLTAIITGLTELTRAQPELMRLCFFVAFAAPGESPFRLQKNFKALEACHFVRDLVIEGHARGELNAAFTVDELAEAFFNLCHHASVLTLLDLRLGKAALKKLPFPPRMEPGRMVALFLRGAAPQELPKRSHGLRRPENAAVACAMLLGVLFIGGSLGRAQTNGGPATPASANAAPISTDASPTTPPTAPNQIPGAPTAASTNAANSVPPGVPAVSKNAAQSVAPLSGPANPLTSPARPVVSNVSPLPGVRDLRPVPAAVEASHPERATVSPIAANADNPRALDLATCFRLTALRDDSLKISLQDILIARAQLSQSIAALWPTFTVSDQRVFIHNRKTSGGSFNVGSNGGLIPAGRNYQSQSNVDMSFTIFNGGQNWNQVGAAAAVVAARKQTLARDYQTIYQSVAQAFYDVLQYEGALAIQDDLIRALQARVDDLRDRVNLGRSRPAELLQSQTDLANAKVTAEQQKGSWNAARETLAFYIGRPAEGIILKETQRFPTAEKLERYLQRAGGRPDVLSELETLRQAQRNLSSAKGQFFPTVTANGDFLASDDPSSATTDATMTIQVSMPIFDGGLILNRVNENRQIVRQVGFNVEQLQRTATEDTRMAYVNFNSSVGQVIVLREAVILAAKNLEAQVDDYLKGVVSNLDVLTALQDYQSVRTQLHSVNMSARLNLINLHVASGAAATGPNVNSKALPIDTTVSGRAP